MKGCLPRTCGSLNCIIYKCVIYAYQNSQFIIEYVEHKNKVALNLNGIRRQKAGRKTTQSIYEVKLEPRVQHPSFLEPLPSSCLSGYSTARLMQWSLLILSYLLTQEYIGVFIINECLWLSF